MGSTGATIRMAKMGDVRMLVGLSSALFREDAGTRDPSTYVGWPARYGREYFADLVGREDGVCLLAEIEGVGVGYLAGYVRGPGALRPVTVAILESMYVRDGARGRGVGTRLVQAFLGWAEERGAQWTSVNAYAANEAAIRLYDRLGFRPRSVTLELGLE